MIETLNAVEQLMLSLNLSYGYGEYDQAIEESNVYFVGEAVDNDTGEDGSWSGYITLSGWSLDEGPLPLLQAREAIQRALRGSLRKSTPTGAVVLEYGSSINVPSDIESVNRLEITLNFIEWSV